VPLIELSTEIRAPRERCFDLARSIDFHVVTATGTQEQAIGGRLSGLIEAGETVTWRARHFGVWHRLTSLMKVVERPGHFRDVMTEGSFASLEHDHYFSEADGVTTMVDWFNFAAPLGPLGRLAELVFLERYMRRFLEERARILKSAAESEEWRRYLPAPSP
jgi:ligand-binding SRPBCC domain-containing protein